MKNLFLLISFFYSSISFSQNISISYLEPGKLTIDSLISKSGMVFVQNTDKSIPRESFKKWHKSVPLSVWRDSILYEIIELDSSKFYAKTILGEKDEYAEREHRMQFIKGYRIVEAFKFRINDIAFGGVKMIFHNDTLISFHCYGNPKIDEVLNYKYGKPQTEEKRDTISCTFIHTGAKISHEKYEITQTWQSQDNSAISFDNKFYNNECEPDYIFTFDLVDREEFLKYTKATKEKLSGFTDAAKKKKEESLKQY